MKIEWIELEKVKPYENNPRDFSKTLPALIESIKKFGFVSPIIVDENYEILVGHARYEACKMLKGNLKDVKEKNLEMINKGLIPVIKVEFLSEDEKREYRLVDNKLNELSVWDWKKLLVELEKIKSIPIGFTEEEIKEIENNLKIDEIDIKFDLDKEIENKIKEENKKAEKTFVVICPNCNSKFEVKI